MRTKAQSRYTTAPEQGTGQPQALRSSLLIRWLFPAVGAQPTRLSSDRLVLGRGEDCDVVLSGTEASREHAELVRDGPIVILRDLGSRNGSHLDGSRVSEAPLAPGNVLRLGEWVGLVAAGEDEARSGGFGYIANDLLGGPELAAALEPARRAARSELPIVLEGETGTGKERVARAIHAWSGRHGPFLAVNCAALPEPLAEGELFGYRRGAFTGADRSHLGHFRAANGGTLLLDEICDLPTSLQAKLLRVLEEQEVHSLGETRPVSIDVRIIAAAQEPLRQAVGSKRFRADLFARLDGVAVNLPPLLLRIGDVPALFLHFMHELLAGSMPVEPRLIEQLCLYDWPFNVRELELLAHKLVTLYGHEPALRRAHLPELLRSARVRSRDGVHEPRPVEPPGERATNELRSLVRALREHNGNVARAAAAVGVSRQRAYRLMNGKPDVDLEALRRQGRGPESAS